MNKKVIGLLVGGSLALFAAGCDDQSHYRYNNESDSYADQLTHEQVWQRDDAQRDWENANQSGFFGELSCRTASGACLHFSCQTKVSCDYLQEVSKKCGIPTVAGKDPKAIEQLLSQEYCSKEAVKKVDSPSWWVGDVTPDHSGNGMISGSVTLMRPEQ